MIWTDYMLWHDNKRDSSTFVINTLNGAKLRFEKGDDCVGAIKSRVIDKLSTQVLERLLDEKFLFENKQAQQSFINKIKVESELWAINNEPTIYVIYLTYNCNIKCNYCCYSHLRGEKESISGESIELIFQSIEEIQKQTGRKRARICLFGGEPLMSQNIPQVSDFFDKFRAFQENQKEKGVLFESMIFTNGVDVPQFKPLLEKNKDIINKVLVTLIGNKIENDSRRKYKDGQGTYDKVVKGINILMELGIKTWPVANVDKKNINQIDNLFKLVIDNDWQRNISFGGYYIGRIKYYETKANSSISENSLLEYLTSWMTKNVKSQNIFNVGDLRNLKPIIKMISDKDPFFQRFYACSSGSLQQFSFAPNGDIHTCSGAMGAKDFSIGRYKPSTIFIDKRLAFWRNRHVLSMDKCMKCNVAFLCGGGCSYASKVIYGDEKHPFCSPIEDLLHTYLYAIEDGVNIKYHDLLRD